MSTSALHINKPNDAWVLHREDLGSIEDGYYSIYFLLDAYSVYSFGNVIVSDFRSAAELKNLLTAGYTKSGKWPSKILFCKHDPCAFLLGTICGDLQIPINDLTLQQIKPFVQQLLGSFYNFHAIMKHPQKIPLSDDGTKELDMAMPESDEPCACASGKIFKVCCQKIFRDITLATCAAQEGNLTEALQFMRAAKTKVGTTAKILCRYAIIWSFFDANKSKEYLVKAQQVNANHPRTNYMLGVKAEAAGENLEAIRFYQKAIDNYPQQDTYHLAETLNNLGAVYFRMQRYKDAKQAWERAMVLLPSDEMIAKNLFECIYTNQDLPEAVRAASPKVENV